MRTTRKPKQGRVLTSSEVTSIKFNLNSKNDEEAQLNEWLNIVSQQTGKAKNVVCKEFAKTYSTLLNKAGISSTELHTAEGVADISSVGEVAENSVDIQMQLIQAQLSNQASLTNKELEALREEVQVIKSAFIQQIEQMKKLQQTLLLVMCSSRLNTGSQVEDWRNLQTDMAKGKGLFTALIKQISQEQITARKED